MKTVRQHDEGFEMIRPRVRKAKAALAIGCATGTLMMMTAPALAQDAAATEETAASADAGLGEILVTARKRQESILDVPVAITALSGEALQERGIKGFNELNDFVPGLRYQNSSANRNDRGFQTFSMRGMYPGDSPNRQGVTVFVDGVAIPSGAIPGMSDIERVEVVKGPQSAYFGRSTFAGAISFTTRAPSLYEFSGHADMSYSGYGTVEGNVSVEAPIVEGVLGARLGGYYYSTDGYYDNVGYPGRAGSRETRSASLSLNFQPSDDLNIRLYGNVWQDSDGASAQALLAEDFYNCNPGGTGRAVDGNNYICGAVSSVPEQWISQNTVLGGLTDYTVISDNGDLPNPLPYDFIDHLGLEREAYQIIGSFTYDIGDYQLSGNFGKNSNDWAALTETYNRADPSYFRAIYLPYNIDNHSAELRFGSNSSSPLQWMIGANYYWEDIFFGTRGYINGTALNLGQPTHYKAETIGVFGSVNYDIGDLVTLAAEGRFQWDTVNHYNSAAAAEDTFDSFSPRLIATFHATDDIDIYASWSRGTRPGTFNTAFYSLPADVIDAVQAVQEVPFAVPEEKLTNYEMGVKGQFFDRRLRLMLAAYYMEWRGRQINQNIPYITVDDEGLESQQTVTVTLANGATDLYGIELEGALEVTPELTFEGTFNWAASEIVYTDCAECVFITGERNPVGNMMQRSPEFSGSASATYRRPVFDDWDGFLRADYTYTGKMYATEANLANTGAANRVNLRAGINNPTYGIELFVINLFDDDTPTNILRSSNPRLADGEGQNTLIVSPPQPLTLGIKGSINF
ncbi:TonB-dependent receptor [Croceicoccus sp. Ery5]|uniref:TonB-dependent receptor n=1 Tax=Croceicoccus sp. Ery5 TaxID=1703340 RepID=UPI001E33904F|nr:TonB-dependent receptor [Croceicoccus sp. Ery5]